LQGFLNSLQEKKGELRSKWEDTLNHAWERQGQSDESQKKEVLLLQEVKEWERNAALSSKRGVSRRPFRFGIVQMTPSRKEGESITVLG